MKRLKVFALAAVIVLPLSGCWGKKDASTTRKVIDQLDNNAIAAREIPAALSEMVRLGLIKPDAARSFGAKSDAFRAANKTLIDFFDSPEFKTKNADGSMTITLTPDGKIKAESLASGLVATAQAIVSDKALFANLSDTSRASLNALFSAANNTAQSFIKLVTALKDSSGKVSIVIPAEDWKQFEHVMEVSYGF